MTISSLRPANWSLFRACVTLRQILTLRKPRPRMRARKLAAICGVWMTAVSCAVALEPILPAPASETYLNSIDPSDATVRPLREIGTTIAPPAGELPANVAGRSFATAPSFVASQLAGRGWADSVYMWQAPALCYRRLYFEEPNVERYGHCAGCFLQPLVSGAHFWATVPLVPVKIVLQRPWSYASPLGHARPGSLAPCQRPW